MGEFPYREDTTPIDSANPSSASRGQTCSSETYPPGFCTRAQSCSSSPRIGCLSKYRPSNPTKSIPLLTPKGLTRLILTLLLRPLPLTQRRMSRRRRILARLNTRIAPSAALHIALSPAIRCGRRYTACRRGLGGIGLFGAGGE